MDFRLTPEQEALRAELRAFLDAEVPEDHPEAHIAPELGTDEEWEWDLDICRKLSRRGWFTPHWPKEWGGLGLGPVELGLFWEELAYRGIHTVNGIGMLVAELLLRFGSDEQRREHLPPIRSAENVWGEGYSEPDAGSDLAGLRTTAIRDGDEYIINGGKIWTGAAHRSNWMFVFSRTAPEAPKHHGISYLMVPMASPGLRLVNIWTLAGTIAINQEFFEDVRVPVTNLIGEENTGWQQRRQVGGRVTGTSPNEPATARRHQEQLVAYCRERQPHVGRLADNPTVRHRLAELAIENEVLRTLTFRVLAERSEGRGDGGVAGEIVGVMRREHMQKTARTGVSILGLHGQLLPDSGPWAPMQSWFARQYLFSVPATIYGGTVEIHRNLIAWGLGLPRS